MCVHVGETRDRTMHRAIHACMHKYPIIEHGEWVEQTNEEE